MVTQTKRILRGQKGFTLIEVIAVLVLVGILAAVAVPRYVDLTTQSRLNALNGLVAELRARSNMNFAQNRLNNTANFITDLGDLYDLGGVGNTDFNDFNLNPVINSASADTWTGTGIYAGLTISVLGGDVETATSPAIITKTGF